MRRAGAGYYVDKLYAESKWEDRVNAFAGHGTQWVTAIRTDMGPTINWWIKSDGKIRVDGKAPAVRVTMARLRKVLAERPFSRNTRGILVSLAAVGRMVVNRLRTLPAVTA